MYNTDFISALRTWIDNNVATISSLDDVAARAGYSKWHLQRMFKAHTGIRLGEYIRNKKLDESARRLKVCQGSILDIALSMGFDSQRSFTRSFKRRFDVTPGVWKKGRMAGKSFERAA
ncbi:AraC family transcriptional regulator [Edwardsiella hoshinae]|uniref:AraC family transcriptional regulator n=1 Tax=Edwardsiella hoshinae TaxID=93378 RepID=A0A376DBT4_9GAMM|nr:helix-turn-helix domain-containing protein [Edwardsiella hoshinae]AOV96464.1 AraC family transcriptional regulator [Edwardsiella hoshinae]QPR27655.1 helix-turn-helix domain-containing protein [Edwardsiella hoshinae]STC86536.1 Multiple antibiotic resistance protein marA [Edwardsiella hoshinae]